VVACFSVSVLAFFVAFRFIPAACSAAALLCSICTKMPQNILRFGQNDADFCVFQKNKNCV